MGIFNSISAGDIIAGVICIGALFAAILQLIKPITKIAKTLEQMQQQQLYYNNLTAENSKALLTIINYLICDDDAKNLHQSKHDLQDAILSKYNKEV